MGKGKHRRRQPQNWINLNGRTVWRFGSFARKHLGGSSVQTEIDGEVYIRNQKQLAYEEKDIPNPMIPPLQEHNQRIERAYSIKK
jgi:hypothetical protein